MQTKRRIILSNTISKTETKPFLIRMSSRNIQCGCWINACFSMNGFVSGSKGHKYRSLEGLSIRIFTTKTIYGSNNESETSIK
jgi:hypothetical protein